MKASRNRMKSNARSTHRDRVFAALDTMDPTWSPERLAAASGGSRYIVQMWRVRNLFRTWSDLRRVAPQAADSLMWTMLVMSNFDVSGF